jgi:hypothetical protein
MADWHRIDAAEVRLQAARMLESDHLRRAGKLRALLVFFVEEWIAYGDRPISQQRLAEDVLGQPREADGIPNAQARIYLWRLRERIAAYYASAGAADPLALGVTHGPYRLSVEPRAAATVAARRAGHARKAAGKKAARRKVKPAALVLTSELSAYGVDGDLKLLPALVPRALMRHLLGQDGLVAIGPVPRHQLSNPLCESPVVRTSAAEYLLEGTLAVRPHRPDGKRPLEIVVRLHEIDSGRHIWSRSCTATLDSRDLVATAEMVAARLAATILAAQG